MHIFPSLPVRFDADLIEACNFLYVVLTFVDVPFVLKSHVYLPLLKNSLFLFPKCLKSEIVDFMYCSRGQVIGLISDVASCFQFLAHQNRFARRLNLDLFVLTHFLKLFANRWLKQVLEGQVEEPPRADQFDHVHLLFKLRASIPQSNLLPICAAADLSLRQEPIDAELLDILTLFKRCQRGRL